MDDLLRGWPTIIIAAGILTGATTANRITASWPTFRIDAYLADESIDSGHVIDVKNIVIYTQCQRYWQLAQAAIPVAIAIVAQLFIWRHSSAYTIGLARTRHESPFAGWFTTCGLFVPWLSLVALVLATFRVWLLQPSILHAEDTLIKVNSQWRMLFAPPKIDVVDRHRPRKHNSSSDA